MDLTGKTALITGASRGIGSAAARAFAEAGARVALTARSGAALEELAAELGDAALALPCDVSDYAAVERAVAQTTERFGGIDVLVGNAAVIEPIGPLAELDPEAFARAAQVNVTGVFNGMRAVLPGMLKAGGGSLLTVSSGAAHRPMEGWAAYCSTKAGAAMLIRSADMEYRGRGIRSMGLSPGTVATQMQREIRASGINPVSKKDWSEHVPPEWPARALVWMATAEADDWLGEEIQLRDPAILERLGLSL